MPFDDDDRKVKALETVLDFCRQQVVFATAMLVLTITFHTKVIPKADVASQTLLVVAWCLLFGSIIAGLLAFGRATYRFADLNEPLARCLGGTRQP